jgi:hypothetical protein
LFLDFFAIGFQQLLDIHAQSNGPNIVVRPFKISKHFLVTHRRLLSGRKDNGLTKLEAEVTRLIFRSMPIPAYLTWQLAFRGRIQQYF